MTHLGRIIRLFAAGLVGCQNNILVILESFCGHLAQSLCCRFFLFCQYFCCHVRGVVVSWISCPIVFVVILVASSFVCVDRCRHLLRNPHNHPPKSFRPSRPSHTSSPSSSFPGPFFGERWRERAEGWGWGKRPAGRGGWGERGARHPGFRKERRVSGFCHFLFFSCFHYFRFLVICCRPAGHLLSPSHFLSFSCLGGGLVSCHQLCC